MLDLALLGLLRRGPRHGYDLKRLLGELGFMRVSFGALYPALRRLEKRGWIAALRPAARRKAYRLTADGRAALDDLLAHAGDELEEDRRFQLRLAFFEFIEPRRRLEILKRRRSQLLPLRAQTGKVLRRAEAAGTDPYTLALIRHNVARVEADIQWLDDLIALARTEAPPQPGRSS